jgi:transposase
MSDYFWLREAQFERIKPYFPLSHGVPRVDDRRVVSGIIHVIRNDLRWRDAPEVYGPGHPPVVTKPPLQAHDAAAAKSLRFGSTKLGIAQEGTHVQA